MFADGLGGCAIESAARALSAKAERPGVGGQKLPFADFAIGPRKNVSQFLTYDQGPLTSYLHCPQH